jgi:hypothetical protein
MKAAIAAAAGSIASFFLNLGDGRTGLACSAPKLIGGIFAGAWARLAAR